MGTQYFAAKAVGFVTMGGVLAERRIVIMNERQQIIYMQTRMMRRACEEWNEPIEEVAGLFVKYDVLQYIEECFGLLHVEGDEAVFEDIKTYLKNKGMTDGGKIGG